jgi:aspartate aminotransferase-like enzyme
MGAQKCTAGPSGIAAVAINDHFIERVHTIRQQGDSNPVYYLDMVSALKKGNDDQTPWTPAINLAMGWAASLRELEDEGLENRWNRCKTLADGVRRLFSDLGFMLLADAGQQSDTVTAIMYPEGMNDSWRSKLKDEYDTQVIGAQDHLKGKMFRVGSMGTTTIEEMIEGCNRMIACFNEMGHALPNVDVASYFA